MTRLGRPRQSIGPIKLVLVAAGMVAVGLLTLVVTRAAVQPAAFEPEIGSVSGPAVVKQMAGASGGSMVQFGDAASVRNSNSRGLGFAAPRLPSLSATQQDAWLDDMKQLGASWVRIDIAWSVVQPANANSYNWRPYDVVINKASQRGLKVLGTIAYTPAWARLPVCANAGDKCRPASAQAYADYAKAVASHYQGSALGAVEIWNEPNIVQFWQPQPEPAVYAAILKAAYAGIKSVDAGLLVMTSGFSPAASDGTNVSPIDFLSAVYANGGGRSFDVLADHPYSYPAPPSDVQTWSAWSQMSQTTPSLRSVLAAHGDSAKPLWLTEVGAPTNGPGLGATCTDLAYTVHPDHVDECLQNRIIDEALTTARQATWTGVTFLYSYQDDGTNTGDRENFFGIKRSDGSAKPSYATVQRAYGQ